MVIIPPASGSHVVHPPPSPQNPRPNLGTPIMTTPNPPPPLPPERGVVDLEGPVGGPHHQHPRLRSLSSARQQPVHRGEELVLDPPVGRVLAGAAGAQQGVDLVWKRRKERSIFYLQKKIEWERKGCVAKKNIFYDYMIPRSLITRNNKVDFKCYVAVLIRN